MLAAASQRQWLQLLVLFVTKVGVIGHFGVRVRIAQHVASGASLLRQEPLQMGETASVAAEFDLVEQISATNAAFRPTPRQIVPLVAR